LIADIVPAIASARRNTMMDTKMSMCLEDRYIVVSDRYAVDGGCREPETTLGQFLADCEELGWPVELSPCGNDWVDETGEFVLEAIV